MNKPFDVVGMGLNSIDFLCIVPEFPTLNSKMKILRFSRQGGGQVATAMAALSRWGIKTKYIGKVGDDELGSLSLNSIRQEGVEVSSVTIEPNATNQFALIIVDSISGERTILWDRDEKLMYREGELQKEEVCSGRLLHLDGHDIRAAIQCALWAKEEGIPTVIDIYRVEPLTSELIRKIDFVITPSRFPTLMTGISDLRRALLELQKKTCGFLCATLGNEGAPKALWEIAFQASLQEESSSKNAMRIALSNQPTKMGERLKSSMSAFYNFFDEKGGLSLPSCSQT